jgi:phytoene synthase
VRPAFEALFAIDAAMGDVVARSTDPALGRIKLAWWREQLESLDTGPPPAEPRLQAVARDLLPLGISGAAIAEIEIGWATLLDEQPDPGFVGVRGVKLFEIGAKLLGATDERLSNAGFLYALMSAARLGYEPSPNVVVPLMQPLRNHRMARRLRPITGLARLAVRDFRRGRPFEPEGSRGRIAAMLAHRWSGRIG